MLFIHSILQHPVLESILTLLITGWNSMQYLLTSEIFPLRIRALATSIAMTLHFANQYGNSRAVPNMLLSVADGGISSKGTFWCFAAITIIGGIWVWVFVPETGGRDLESMNRLFSLPWYQIGLRGYKDAARQDIVINEKEEQALDVAAGSGQAEHADRVGEDARSIGEKRGDSRV